MMGITPSELNEKLIGWQTLFKGLATIKAKDWKNGSYAIDISFVNNSLSCGFYRACQAAFLQPESEEESCMPYSHKQPRMIFIVQNHQSADDYRGPYMFFPEALKTYMIEIALPSSLQDNTSGVEQGMTFFYTQPVYSEIELDENIKTVNDYFNQISDDMTGEQKNQLLLSMSRVLNDNDHVPIKTARACCVLS